VGSASRSTARQRLTAQAAHPDAGEPFADEVMAAVGTVVGFDGWCLLGLDPVSGARSFMFCRDGVGDPKRLAHNEWAEHDVNRYVELAEAQVPVGVLSATVPQQGSSPRLQEILLPDGMTSELRVVLTGHGRTWGALCLFRAHRSDAFDDADIASVLDLLGPLAESLRRYPVRAAEPTLDLTDPGPGVLLLGPDDTIVSSTPACRAWLSEAVAGGFDEDRPERIHRAVYEVARLARAGGPAISRIRTARGFWLAITGSRLDASDDVAVVVQRATAHQLVPALAEWHGLTPRERDVLGCVLDGLPTKLIARRLELSPYTVNDHLTAIYRKVDVRGRDELMASLV
jgi:DNA-binding CsgD family transcriptional regulator